MPTTKRKTRKTNRPLAAALAEIARVGAMFIDGDAAEAVHADRTSATWTDPDDIHFAHEPFVNVKRTILLIERIEPMDYHALFALIRADDPARIEAVVCGSLNPLGRAPVAMSKAQRECLRQGRVTAETDRRRGLVSAYAPVGNSDAEIVGLLHVFAAAGQR